jgi:ATP-dependent helicase HrpB
MSKLPIEPVLPDIRDALERRRSLVLQAPPGAGKTTFVPLALRDAPWLAGQSIVMLEPRRVATRAAASRLAELVGERVGETVGYRMRGDSRVGPRTRIEVVTEGILTRRLQRDPTLDGVGLVIFDEFHERSLDADLGLALVSRTRDLVRDDLRILIMSATLNGESVARLLGGAPIVTSEGRGFPVETRYVPPRPGVRIEGAVVASIVDALARVDGDILVFLPGTGEIRRVESLLAARALDAIVTPLYGALRADAQDRAIRPDPEGRRKIVLSTSIAETSLTIEGVRAVVDSGFARVPRFASAVGMARLETVRVSKASADQRRGRAGRLAPGVCYRLWDEHETLHFLDQSPPEILHADLAPLALDLAAAGVADPLELAWLDPPPPTAFAQAREVLSELEALDARGGITPHGRAMAALPLHPRLAHMLLGAKAVGAERPACDVAALLSDRDVFRSADAVPDADIALRIEALRGRDVHHTAAAEVDRDSLRRVRAESERLARHMGTATANIGADAHDDLGTLLALAYPDRIAQRRPGTRARFLLRNGRGAELVGAQSLSESPYLVAAQLDDRRPEARIFLAAPVTLDEIRARFADQIAGEDVVEFDDATGVVLARRQERLGAIVLREIALEHPDPASIRHAMLTAIRRRGVGALPWPPSALRLRERIAFVARHEAGWPVVSDGALQATLEVWLGPMLDGVRRLADLERLDYVAALTAMLDWRQRRALDELAPSHAVMPTGSRIAIDYADPEAPSLSVRIQEVFGLAESPRVLGGRVPLTMQLLSPAHRPVQVTRDLAGFWRTSYFDVRKDLRGRYPKHEWPEDPLAATPTRRAKPRR